MKTKVQKMIQAFDDGYGRGAGEPVPKIIRTYRSEGLEHELIQCPECKTNVRIEDRYCRGCGVKFKGAEYAQEVRK